MKEFREYDNMNSTLKKKKGRGKKTFLTRMFGQVEMNQNNELKT